jgi:hypothetical protein
VQYAIADCAAEIFRDIQRAFTALNQRRYYRQTAARFRKELLELL